MQSFSDNCKLSVIYGRLPADFALYRLPPPIFGGGVTFPLKNTPLVVINGETSWAVICSNSRYCSVCTDCALCENNKQIYQGSTKSKKNQIRKS